MIDQGVKEVLWQVMAPGLVISKAAARLRFHNARGLKLHLGAGPVRLPDFLNVDINPLRKPDLWLDVRGGLPFRDSSASYIYTSHTIEHFGQKDLMRLLAECHRVLMADGVLRIVVPDLRKAIKAYSERRAEWFIDWPQKFQSPGGRFTNYIFCDAQHKCAFDSDFLSELLAGTGFGKVVETCSGESSAADRYPPAVLNYERGQGDDRSLFIEAYKRTNGHAGSVETSGDERI
jgi:predicted SAM-dependent methyltransferase